MGGEPWSVAQLPRLRGFTKTVQQAWRHRRHTERGTCEKHATFQRMHARCGLPLLKVQAGTVQHMILLRGNCGDCGHHINSARWVMRIGGLCTSTHTCPAPAPASYPTKHQKPSLVCQKADHCDRLQNRLGLRSTQTQACTPVSFLNLLATCCCAQPHNRQLVWVKLWAVCSYGGR